MLPPHSLDYYTNTNLANMEVSPNRGKNLTASGQPIDKINGVAHSPTMKELAHIFCQTAGGLQGGLQKPERFYFRWGLFQPMNERHAILLPCALCPLILEPDGTRNKKSPGFGYCNVHISIPSAGKRLDPGAACLELVIMLLCRPRSRLRRQSLPRRHRQASHS